MCTVESRYNEPLYNEVIYINQIVGTLNDISHVFATPASSTEQCCTEADATFRKRLRRAKFGRDWKGVPRGFCFQLT